MDLSNLRTQLNKMVRLTFHDGEIVDAVLLGADSDRDHDLTYEVRRIISRPEGKREHLVVGATLVGSLAELKNWEAL